MFSCSLLNINSISPLKQSRWWSRVIHAFFILHHTSLDIEFSSFSSFTKKNCYVAKLIEIKGNEGDIQSCNGKVKTHNGISVFLKRLSIIPPTQALTSHILFSIEYCTHCPSLWESQNHLIKHLKKSISILHLSKLKDFSM